MGKTRKQQYWGGQNIQVTKGSFPTRGKDECTRGITSAHGAHRTRRTRGPDGIDPARSVGLQAVAILPSQQARSQPAFSGEYAGASLEMHFHWCRLDEVPPSVCLRPAPGALTSGRERKRRAGRGGAKMAAPLRIQNDWAQALRWKQAQTLNWGGG